MSFSRCGEAERRGGEEERKESTKAQELNKEGERGKRRRGGGDRDMR
jgi:hypothetical protein